MRASAAVRTWSRRRAAQSGRSAPSSSPCSGGLWYYGQTETSPGQCEHSNKIAKLRPLVKAARRRRGKIAETARSWCAVRDEVHGAHEGTRRWVGCDWRCRRVRRDGYPHHRPQEDFIKNSGGDMIAPARISALTLSADCPGDAAYGDRRPYLVAVVVPSEWAIARAKGGLQRCCRRQVAASRPRRITVTISPRSGASSSRNPSPPAMARQTPTLKICRHAIRQAQATRQLIGEGNRLVGLCDLRSDGYSDSMADPRHCRSRRDQRATDASASPPLAVPVVDNQNSMTASGPRGLVP